MPRLKMRGAMPPFSQYVFMALYFDKNRNNFTFTSQVKGIVCKL